MRLKHLPFFGFNLIFCASTRDVVRLILNNSIHFRTPRSQETVQGQTYLLHTFAQTPKKLSQQIHTEISANHKVCFI